jgi:hypothetical protein
MMIVELAASSPDLELNEEPMKIIAFYRMGPPR